MADNTLISTRLLQLMEKLNIDMNDYIMLDNPISGTTKFSLQKLQQTLMSEFSGVASPDTVPLIVSNNYYLASNITDSTVTYTNFSNLTLPSKTSGFFVYSLQNKSWSLLTIPNTDATIFNSWLTTKTDVSGGVASFDSVDKLTDIVTNINNIVNPVQSYDSSVYISDNDGFWATTDYIAVETNDRILVNGYGDNSQNLITYFDSNKTNSVVLSKFLNGIDVLTTVTVTISNDGYVKIRDRYGNNKKDYGFTITKNNSDVLFKKDLGYTVAKQEDVINLFNNQENSSESIKPITSKYINFSLDASGNIVSNVNHNVTDYIQIYKNDVIAFNSDEMYSSAGTTFVAAIFDSNKKIISTISAASTSTYYGVLSDYTYTATGDGYILISTLNNQNNTKNFYYKNTTTRTHDRFLTSDVLDNLTSNLFDVGNSFELGKPETLIKVDYVGDLSAGKGDVKQGTVTLTFGNLSFKKYATLEVQGATSTFYAKKNFTLGLYNDADYSDEFDLKINNSIYINEWVLKANFIDATQTRNIVCNRLWEDMVNSRSTYPLNEVDNTYLGLFGTDSVTAGATGYVNGYPYRMYVNGDFYGLGTFNLGKKRDNYNLDKSNKSQVQLNAQNVVSFTSFGSTNWELRNPKLKDYVAGGTISDTDVMTTINTIMTFNSSKQADFNTSVDTYYNRINVIDFMLHQIFIHGSDSWQKNLMYQTFDGVKWYFLPYDLDTTFGLQWDGSSIANPPTKDLGMLTNSFYGKFYTAWKSDFQARYKYLRDNGIFTAANIYKKVDELQRIFGQKYFKKEFTKWTVPSVTFTSLQQIVTWTAQRITYLDTIFNYTAS